MRISSTMDLGQLAERMYKNATKTEAKHMRATLNEIGLWEQTEDIPEQQWLDMVDGAIAQAMRDE